MTTLQGNVFDRIDVWGQPWHGRMNAAGVLDLGGGKTKTSTIIPTGGQAQLVQFAGLPTPTDKACDTAVGASWKNWAILAGNRRQYMPLTEYYFEANSWLYRTADGTVWCLQVYCDDVANPVTIRARNVHKEGGVWETVYTGLAAYKSIIIAMTNARRTALSASKTGNKALIHLEQSYTASLGITGNANWVATYAITTQPVSATFAEITVTDGSATVAPTVALAMLATDDVFSHEAYTVHSSASVHDHAKWLIGAWMRPDGVVAKTYIDVDIVRSLTGDGLSWSALAGTTVAAKLILPEGDVAILDLTSTASISAGGGSTSITTTTTPPGETTAVQASFFISHAPSADGAVQKLQVNGISRAFGGLGQQANPITAAEYSPGIWCQHPITGELTVAGHYF